MALRHLSTSFQPSFCRSASFLTRFHDFGQKRGKRVPKMEERERKKRISFLFLSRSLFFPFLSWNISRYRDVELPIAATIRQVQYTVHEVNVVAQFQFEKGNKQAYENSGYQVLSSNLNVVLFVSPKTQTCNLLQAQESIGACKLLF